MINHSKLVFTFLFVFSLCGFSYSQVKPTENSKATAKSTPAYAELLLQMTEIESDIASFLVSYTDEYPKLKEARFELALVQKDISKLLAQTDLSKLTLALGKLMVRKNRLETDLWALQNQYGKEHPEVKRMQRKVAIFQNAVKEILP